ncbi:MAG: sulfur oxidation protein SoxY [Betaproteobacteria bacterium]|nr:sulfur oxidation protein SoxY [Betaproteobacteria bacterium]
MKPGCKNIARRRVLKSLAGGVLLPAAAPALAQMPSTQRLPLMQLVPVLKDIAAGKPVNEGKVKLEIPHLAENGHLVPLTVSVESPMTPDNHVRTLYLFSEKNPRPIIAKIGMGPGTGRAALTTRIRLSGAQYVVAVAQMSDGSLWAAAADVIVTETACLDAT